MASRNLAAVGTILMLATAATLLVYLSESDPIMPMSQERAGISVDAREAASMRINQMTADPMAELPQRVPLPEPRKPDVPQGYEAKDVRDLLPKLRAGMEDAKSPFSAMDLLVANMKKVTGLSYWDSAPGGHILQSSAGYVLVHANREMQQRVDRFLEDLRRRVSSPSSWFVVPPPSGPRRR